MSTPTQPKVFASVLIVTRGRLEQLKRCLASIETSSHPFTIEVIVIINGDCPPTLRYFEILNKYRFIQCTQRTPAAARNIALECATGEFLCFLDDDVAIPTDYFDRFWSAYHKHPNLDVLGGPDTTFLDAELREQAIGLALRSPLATARTRFRHGVSSNTTIALSGEKQLILCNLWIKRTIFSEEGHRFDERFMRNEENVLLFQLQDRKILFDPNLFVYHQRKVNLRSFVKAVYQSGFYRAQTYFQYPGAVDFEFFVPSLFCIYLTAVPFLMNRYSFIPIGLYMCLNIYFSVWIAIKNTHLMGAPFISLYQLLINIAYGLGFMRGLLAWKSSFLRHLRFEHGQSQGRSCISELSK